MALVLVPVPVLARTVIPLTSCQDANLRNFVSNSKRACLDGQLDGWTDGAGAVAASGQDLKINTLLGWRQFLRCV